MEAEIGAEEVGGTRVVCGREVAVRDRHLGNGGGVEVRDRRGLDIWLMGWGRGEGWAGSGHLGDTLGYRG